ncbi:acetyl-CoA carboxylase biotin carboxylase subunit family protein [Streptomyces sp. NPDC093223]|uniref:ATP-grasp domain-containing protein n=1 Tax=Streptomyces sp. NPDC093223 TaxID=3366033 RepID=UPI0037F147D9
MSSDARTTASTPYAAPRPLLVLGSGSQPYRQHSLSRLAARHPLVLADAEPPQWTRPYVRHQLLVDLTDTEGTAAAVKDLAEKMQLAGVCTYLEHHVELAAHLAAQAGLPGTSPASVAACRDKSATRRKFAEHGVPSARSVPVADEDDAVAQARLIGYPVVIKPRAMAGSAGVRRADHDGEVRDAFPAASRETVLGLDAYAPVSGVLVEEYLDGPEISAETVVAGDQVHIVAVTRKRLGAEPRFLETGHTVDARDPLLADDAVRQTVTHAVRALGITRGVLHVELRLTERGPVLIEVNARPAGDLIPVLVELATGVDLMAAAAALATGSTPDLTPTRHRAAAVEFHYPAFSGRVAPVGPLTTLRARPWLDRLVWTRHLGELVSAAPRATIDDRLGHWVVTGDSADECRQRITEVLMELPPLTGPAAGHTTTCAR